MSEHITQWLGVYLDDELRGAKLRQVENHLSECAACQMELDDLRGLSALLRETPLPDDFLPRERFVANLTLSLPRQNGTTQAPKATELGWWMIPAGIILAWIFMQLSTYISTVLLVAVNLGFLGEGLSWLWSGAVRQSIWFAWLVNLIGGPAGNLALFNTIDLFLRDLFSHYFWQAMLGILYLAWLVRAWQKQTVNSGSLSQTSNV
jgi:predicted anti-sigma-YlaC factor YlaD